MHNGLKILDDDISCILDEPMMQGLCQLLRALRTKYGPLNHVPFASTLLVLLL